MAYTLYEKRPAVNHDRTKGKASQALEFCQQQKFSTRFCMLADMSLHSGIKRMFIWDFEKDTVILSGLVSHGCGSNPWGADATRLKPVFSNVPESYCSSQGKYKIGKRGYSNWGININYRLHGLEKGNSNALKRQIVLHSWDRITDHELFPGGTPEGWGCPAVSDNFMRAADKLLADSKKPVLLWIYE